MKPSGRTQRRASPRPVTVRALAPLFLLFCSLQEAEAAAPPWTAGFPPGNWAPSSALNTTASSAVCPSLLGKWSNHSSPVGGSAALANGGNVYAGAVVGPYEYYGSGAQAGPFGGYFQPCVGYNARALSGVDLYALSAGQCTYVPDFIQDTFSNPSLNLYSWQPAGSYPYLFSNQNIAGNLSTFNPVYASGAGFQYAASTAIFTPWSPIAGTFQKAGGLQDHCPAVGAVGAASPSTCTFLNPQSLQLAAPLSAAPGDIGAIMTLTQSTCFNADGSNNAQCCAIQEVACTSAQRAAWTAGGNSGSCPPQSVNICAAWSGAHLSSQFCAQYGVIEAEARFNMPVAGGAFGTFEWSPR